MAGRRSGESTSVTRVASVELCQLKTVLAKLKTVLAKHVGDRVASVELFWSTSAHDFHVLHVLRASLVGWLPLLRTLL
jgi:hypothetical protein